MLQHVTVARGSKQQRIHRKVSKGSTLYFGIVYQRKLNYNNIEREYWRARYSISSFKYRLARKTNFGKSKKKARKRADETTTMGKKEEKHSTQESQRRPSSVFAVDTSVRDYDQRIS
jgi:hypothetical protein